MIKKAELILPVLLLAVIITMYIQTPYQVIVLLSWMLAALINIGGGWYLFKGNSPKSNSIIATISGFAFTIVYISIGMKLISVGYQFFFAIVSLFALSMSFLLTLFHPANSNPEFAPFIDGIKYRHVIYSVALMIITFIPNSVFLTLKYHGDDERIRLEEAVIDNPLDSTANANLENYILNNSY
ncbi:MAG TPA: hypothetical protein VIL57_08355 [Bacteroidia bacterium]